MVAYISFCHLTLNGVNFKGSKSLSDPQFLRQCKSCLVVVKRSQCVP